MEQMAARIVGGERPLVCVVQVYPFGRYDPQEQCDAKVPESRRQEATSRGDGNLSAYLNTTSRWERSRHIASGLKLVRTSRSLGSRTEPGAGSPSRRKPVSCSADKRGAGRFIGRVSLASLRGRAAVTVPAHPPKDLAQAYRSAVREGS